MVLLARPVSFLRTNRSPLGYLGLHVFCNLVGSCLTVIYCCRTNICKIAQKDIRKERKLSANKTRHSCLRELPRFRAEDEVLSYRRLLTEDNKDMPERQPGNCHPWGFGLSHFPFLVSISMLVLLFAMSTMGSIQ